MADEKTEIINVVKDAIENRKTEIKEKIEELEKECICIYDEFNGRISMELIITIDGNLVIRQVESNHEYTDTYDGEAFIIARKKIYGVSNDDDSYDETVASYFQNDEVFKKWAIEHYHLDPSQNEDVYDVLRTLVDCDVDPIDAIKKFDRELGERMEERYITECYWDTIDGQFIDEAWDDFIYRFEMELEGI